VAAILNMPSAPSVAQLAVAARDGDRTAAAQLYARLQPRVYRQAYLMVRNADVASDLTQEAFARAFSRLDDYDPQRASFATWVYAITLNLTREHWRTTQRQARIADKLAGVLSRFSRHDPERALDQADARAELEEALDRLPASQREAVVLVDVQQLSVDEAAQCLGLSAGNVRVRVHRGRKRLQALLRGRKA
jgi:RNA polymerase sigma-70 factor (ECF subfamily)